MISNVLNVKSYPNSTARMDSALYASYGAYFSIMIYVFIWRCCWGAVNIVSYLFLYITQKDLTKVDAF